MVHISPDPMFDHGFTGGVGTPMGRAAPMSRAMVSRAAWRPHLSHGGKEALNPSTAQKALQILKTILVGN